MKLVVGLGNPGKDYQGTRHNIGFEVVAGLASRHGSPRPKLKFQAELAEIQVVTNRVWLASPLTYMNLSGQSVRKIVEFFKIERTDLILICDDMSLEVGRLRIRAGGSAGGQKGLASAIDCLGSDDFPRLRVGIGQPPGTMSASDFVLQRFTARERTEIDVAVQRACDAVETWICDGIGAAMNRFNVKTANNSDGQAELG